MPSPHEDTPHLDVRQVCERLQARADMLDGIGLKDELSSRAAWLLGVMSRRLHAATKKQIDEGTEPVAASMWRQEAMRAGIQSAIHARTPEAFAEESEETRQKWLVLARSALFALREGE